MIAKHLDHKNEKQKHRKNPSEDHFYIEYIYAV